MTRVPTRGIAAWRGGRIIRFRQWGFHSAEAVRDKRVLLLGSVVALHATPLTWAIHGRVRAQGGDELRQVYAIRGTRSGPEAAGRTYVAAVHNA